MTVFATKITTTLYGDLGFEKVTEGFSGSGWRSMYQNLQVSFLDASEGRKSRSVRINFEIERRFNKRTVRLDGGLSLSEAQAAELALALLPPELVPRVREVLANVIGETKP